MNYNTAPPPKSKNHAQKKVCYDPYMNAKATHMDTLTFPDTERPADSMTAPIYDESCNTVYTSEFAWFGEDIDRDFARG